jgi:O-antigen/teichoic acid export membrane protein
MIISAYSSKEHISETFLFQTFKDSTLLLSAILFPLFAWMFFYSTDIVTVLFGSKYRASSELFALSALFIPVRICNYTVMLQIKNNGREILVGSIIDLIVSGLLMVLLYPLLNLNGLVLALVIATYIQASYYLYQITKIYKISIREILPLSKLFFRLLFCVLIVYLVKDSFSFLSPLHNWILGSVVAIGVSIFYLRLSIGSYLLKNFLEKKIIRK